MGDLLKDKVAVVTGSGRGLGRAFVMALADEGAKVVVNDLGIELDASGATRGPADDVVAEIRQRGGTAVANYDSVATPEGGENIINTAVENFGKIDILVNNAGVLRDRMVFNLSDEDWDIVIKTHLYGHFYCSRAACRLMRQQKSGRIIGISSIGGGGPAPLANPGQTNYTAAKAGIIGLIRTLALEMGRYGVTCNVLFPAARTRMSWNPALEEAWRKRQEAGVVDSSTYALEGLATGEFAPEDVAPMVVYLASDAASNINGCVFHVMGKAIHQYSAMEPIRSIFSRDKWTVAELLEFFPQSIGRDIVNPAPPAPPKE